MGPVSLGDRGWMGLRDPRQLSSPGKAACQGHVHRPTCPGLTFFNDEKHLEAHVATYHSPPVQGRQAALGSLFPASGVDQGQRFTGLPSGQPGGPHLLLLAAAVPPSTWLYKPETLKGPRTSCPSPHNRSLSKCRHPNAKHIPSLPTSPCSTTSSLGPAPHLSPLRDSQIPPPNPATSDGCQQQDQTETWCVVNRTFSCSLMMKKEYIFHQPRQQKQ